MRQNAFGTKSIDVSWSVSVATSWLNEIGEHANHGFTPMATICRHFVANDKCQRIAMHVSAGASTSRDRPRPPDSVYNLPFLSSTLQKPVPLRNTLAPFRAHPTCYDCSMRRSIAWATRKLRTSPSKKCDRGDHFFSVSANRIYFARPIRLVLDE